MWNRSELKSNAKKSLRGYYWVAFVVCFIANAIAGFLSTTVSYVTRFGEALSSDYEPEYYSNSEYYDELENYPNLQNYYNVLLIFLAVFGIILLISFIISISYNIFIGNIIQVGKKYFFLSGREQTPQFSSLFMSFRRGRYSNTLKTTFLSRLYISLWSLLFIIPGIIKSYEYFMVDYILAENPELSTSRVLEISKHMTRGDKFNIFILELSFFGWYILGVFACCIGINFLNPYVEATLAELYGQKRQEALDSGFVSYYELPGFNN